MAKTFVVKTVAWTDYDNMVEVSEEELEEYRKDYPLLTDEEIVGIMYMDGNVIRLDSVPTDWRAENVESVEKIKDGEQYV